MEIPDELAAVLPGLIKKTGCNDWTVLRRPLDRRECRIHFLHSETFRPGSVVLKVYQEGAAGLNFAKNLHRRSCCLFKGATSSFTIPEPVCFMGNRRALAMEFVDAPLAGALLGKRFQGRGRRESVVRLAAGWLRWFHEQSGITQQPFTADSYSNKLAMMVRKIEQVKPGGVAGDRLLSECIECSMKIADGLHGVSFPHAVAHGDFTPFNLFILGGTAIGFDYGPRQRLPLFHDICRFLVYLDVRRILPCAVAEVRAFGCRKDDLEVFMDAYAPEGMALFEGLWPGLHFMELTRRITALTLRRENRRRNFHLFSGYEMSWLRRNARLLRQMM